MSIAIIYATKHGCTDKCAHTLSNEIIKETTLINLETNAETDISEYDTVVIGGSIHAGMINKKIKKFINKNQDMLLKKKIGLFLCCMFEGDTALKQFQDAYPESLRKKAVAHGLFGGELDFNKMNVLERALVKKIANVDKSISRISYSNIKEFAKQFKDQ